MQSSELLIGNASPHTPQRGDRQPGASAHLNFSDLNSDILKGVSSWIQGYNCQTVVEDDHQGFIAIGMSNKASDAVNLLPLPQASAKLLLEGGGGEHRGSNLWR